MKIITAKVHSYIDYVLVLFLILSPIIFNMSGLLVFFTYGLALVHFLLTMFTSFQDKEVLNLIPFFVHGLIELIVGIALIICAYTIFRNSSLGNLFYTSLGTVVLLVWLLTDYNPNYKYKR